MIRVSAEANLALLLFGVPKRRRWFGLLRAPRWTPAKGRLLQGLLMPGI